MWSEVAELIHAGSRTLMAVLMLSALALALLSPLTAAFSLRGSVERRLDGWLKVVVVDGYLELCLTLSLPSLYVEVCLDSGVGVDDVTVVYG